MSYDHGSGYREYALIQAISLLVNMVKQLENEKTNVKKIFPIWQKSGLLTLGDQIELIFGTAANELRCRYMVHCINELNSYMLSKYPYHRMRIRQLTRDVVASINMAVMAHAHIWNEAQFLSIQAAFTSGHMKQSYQYYKPSKEEIDEEEREKEEKEERYVLEYKGK